MLSSTSRKPILLMSVYIPPDGRRKEAVSHLCRTLEFLYERYSSFSLLGFGDLNVNLTKSPLSSEAKKLLLALSRLKVKIHNYKVGTRPTRKQGLSESHLDYYFTVGTELDNLSVGEHLGGSDHRLISCTIMDMKPVRRKRKIIFSKRKAAAVLKQLLEGG